MKKLSKYFCLSFLLFSVVGISTENESISFVKKRPMIRTFKKSLLKKGVKFFKTVNTDPTPINPKKTLIIELNNPSYKNGILTTHDGGVIRNSEIRIQAKTIQYTRIEGDVPIHKIEAESDLMVQYKNKVYIGEELEYDFIKNEGTIYQGKTFSSPWYIGGDKIDLKNNGTYRVKNVFLTTCENRDSTWDIHAGKVEVINQQLLKANDIQFRFFKVPTFWLPSFKTNLKKFFSTPLIRYKLNYDKHSGVRGSMRYRLYSWKDFALFGRVDYRFKKGFGGAIETEYFSKENKTSLITRSYLASDTLPNDPKKKQRYRLQGAFHSTSPQKSTTFDMTWDKFSDIHMPSDFKSDDFEIDTARKTEAKMRHQENNFISILYAKPRLNNFETVKQEIPSFYTSIRPYQLPPLGIITDNTAKLSYLDFVYSNKLKQHLNDFNSVRIQTTNSIYRPFNFKGFKLTPNIGIIGIYYNHLPYNDDFGGLGILQYGCKLSTLLFKNYTKYKHIIQPYLDYKGLSKPTLDNSNHYIFSIEDGYYRTNQLQGGVKNQFFILNENNGKPYFEIDFFANAFLGSHKLHKVIPKGYLDLIWNLPSMSLNSYLCWNIEKQILDFSNISLAATLNENIAGSIEFRYRSSYDWRKANKDNFTLDLYQPSSSLHYSPLSDKRNTILTKLFFRFSPFWSCLVESHHGWNRYGEPPYNELKINLYTMISSFWQLRISYTHTQVDDRISFGASLIKK